MRKSGGRHLVRRAIRHHFAAMPPMVRMVLDRHLGSHVRRWLEPDVPPTVREVLDRLATRDRWFHEHFVKLPLLIAEELARVVPLESSIVLDFGCGEGLVSKGLARFVRQVHGVDLMPVFEGLEERVERTLGVPYRLPPVMPRRVEPNEPLPYPDGTFDAVFSWSVFEHVADVPLALREIHRVLRPGGAFFLQIRPLYHSAQGGHLWNILDEPWIHLKLDREELLDRVRGARLDAIPEAQRHEAFQGETPETYRAGVLACHDSLNRITVGELVRRVQEAGFTILDQRTMQDGPSDLPSDLLELHSREDLTIAEVVLLMVR